MRAIQFCFMIARAARFVNIFTMPIVPVVHKGSQLPASEAYSHLQAVSIESILALALQDFDAWLKLSHWKAKENDCVNHFAHAFLAKRTSPGAALYDLGQIGIEVGVPQPAGLGIKPAVRKDLVIWGAPGMTTWDDQYRACKSPIAIVEWKARKQELSERDLKWLTGFTSHFPSCFGAAVTVDFGASGSRLHTAAVRAGIVERNWLTS